MKLLYSTGLSTQSVITWRTQPGELLVQRISVYCSLCTRTVSENFIVYVLCEVLGIFTKTFLKGDFLSDNFPSGNFPYVHFPKRQLPKGYRLGLVWGAVAVGSSAAARTDFGSCRLRFVLATSKNTLGKWPSLRKNLCKNTWYTLCTSLS